MIREYRPSDLETIKRLHPNPAYEMPDLEHPLMLVRKCIVDEQNQVRMAAFGRLHINALLYVDHSWETPDVRLLKLIDLQEAMMAEARERGLDIATTQMEGRFALRMQELGWVRGWGEIYYHEI